MLLREFLVLCVISTTTLFLLSLPLLSIPIGYPQYASGFLHENLLGLNPPATILTSPSVSRGIGSSLTGPSFSGGLGYGSGLLGLLPSLLGIGSSTFAPGSGMGYGMDYGASSFDQGFDSEFQPSYDPFGSELEPDSGYDQSLTEFQPSYDPFSSESDSASFDQSTGSEFQPSYDPYGSESSFDTPIEDLRSTDDFSTEDSFSSYEGSSDYFSEIPTEDLRETESFP